MEPSHFFHGSECSQLCDSVSEHECSVWPMDQRWSCFRGPDWIFPRESSWPCRRLSAIFCLNGQWHHLVRNRHAEMKGVKEVILTLVRTVHACAQSCLTLCDPMDCSPPGYSVHGILWARILEWVAICYSRGSPDPGTEPMSLVSPALAGGYFNYWAN